MYYGTPDFFWDKILKSFNTSVQWLHLATVPTVSASVLREKILRPWFDYKASSFVFQHENILAQQQI